MPANSRVSSRKAAKSRVAAAKPRRKIARKPRKAADGVQADISPFLIAQFAEALGEVSSPRSKARKGKSLRDALGTVGPSQSIFCAMPGFRIEEPAVPAIVMADMPPAPCVAVHRRHRLRARLAHAASYCFAILVSAGIIGATAFGIASHAPRSGHATLALNEPVHRPPL